MSMGGYNVSALEGQIEKFETPADVGKYLRELIQEAEDWADTQKIDREKFIEYYDGKMHDYQAKEGRSEIVMKEIRASVRKVMPSIMRALMGNDKVVEYHPTSSDPEKTEQSKLATEYINNKVIPECRIEDALHDAIFDAVLVKTGVLTWGAYRERTVKYYQYRGVDQESLLGLQEMPDVEVQDVKEQADGTMDFTVKRTMDSPKVYMKSVPRGGFLIHPSAEEVEDSPIVGEREYLRRSELIAMGYDRKLVDRISSYSRGSEDDDFDDKMAWRGEDWVENRTEVSRLNEEVMVYKVYVPMDLDDDGITEIQYFVMGEGSFDEGVTNDPLAVDEGDVLAGDGTSYVILDHSTVDEIPFSKVVVERSAHQFEGHSIAEDVLPYQKVKTALTRSTLDNVYHQNYLTPVINSGKIVDTDAFFNPEYGKPVETTMDVDDVRKVVSYLDVPFIGNHTFTMLEYMDDQVRDVTGITDRSGGLNPQAVQNVPATTASLLSESGMAQAEMIIRSLSRGGIKKAFKGLLKEVILNTHTPQMAMKAGQPTMYNPAVWDLGMNCEVNVGLGMASRSQDIMALERILAIQNQVVSEAGVDNGIVAPSNIYNTLEKICEASGLPSAAPYFTPPNDQQLMQKAAEQKSDKDKELEGKKEIEMLKQKAKMEADATKTKHQAQLEQAKANANIQLEQAQMEADVNVKEVEAEAKIRTELLVTEQKMKMEEMKYQFEMEKLLLQMQIDKRKADLEERKMEMGMAADLVKTENEIRKSNEKPESGQSGNSQ